MPVIMGIDPSLSATGWYLLDIENRNSKYGEINSKRKEIERLMDIEEGIKNQLPMAKLELAVMEKAFYSPYYGSAIGNVELGAILKRLFHIEGIPLVLVVPTTLKKWITGSGKSKKNEILRKAYQKWGISESEHITEAFALAKIGEMVLKKENKEFVDKLMGYEKEVLKTVMKGNDIDK